MSYLVLARKYRPKTFAEMVGQEHVVRALGNALTQQRLHHAYLFTGTRGVGKTTVSRILAKSLNCQGADGQGGITAAPCGVCEACRDIDAGRFVDYVELDAASNRGVDEVQALLEQAVYKPVQGRFKVFMIDEVHMLTGHAFNAMLKTLEEPPDYLKFVLATTDPQKVPVTVLSRCLQFNLRPMAPETVQEHLVQVLQAEGVPASEAALRLIARAARGSMRDALSLTDQAIAFGNGTLEEAAVRQMLGSADLGHVLRLIEALARGDGRTVVEIADTLRTHALNAAATLEEMCSVLQRMAVVQAVPEAAGGGDPDAAAIARLAQLMPSDETQLLYGLCLHGRAELGLAPDEYSALTMVLLRLLAFQAPRHGAVAGAAEKKTLSETAVVAAPAGEAPAAPPEQRAPAPAARARAPDVVRATAPPGRVLPVVEPRAERLPQRPAPWGGGGGGPPPPPRRRGGGGGARRPPPPGAPRGRGSPAAAAQPAGDVVGVPVHVPPESPRDAAVAAPEVVPTEDGDFWQATVAELVAREAVTALVRELALQSQLVARDDDHWMLRVERESLNQPGSRERLRQALHGAGHAVNISVEVGPVTDSPARRVAAAQARRQRAAEEVIRNDPFVQAMMRDFGARIVPGSIKPASP